MGRKVGFPRADPYRASLAGPNDVKSPGAADMNV